MGSHEFSNHAAPTGSRVFFCVAKRCIAIFAVAQVAGDNAVKSTTVVTAVRGSAFPPAVALRVQFSYFSCALSLRVSFSISSFMIKRRSARISSCARVPILVENGQLFPQLLPCKFSFQTFRIHCHVMFLFHVIYLVLMHVVLSIRK